MILKSKSSVAILDEVPYILLVPIHNPENNDLVLSGLKEFLKENYRINHIATQSASQLQIEEQDFIVAVKNIDSEYFCALKILFKSCLEDDFDREIQVVYSLINKYQLEVFDGKTHSHLAYTRSQLKDHILETHREKKKEFLQNLLPKYAMN
ncbi:MAG TPA: hypothetical protein VF622_01650 [Segetibacter sp.]|jgi:hypothetical protein